MELFIFLSTVLYGIGAAAMLALSALVFGGSRLVIKEKTEQAYNIRLYRIYFGLFYLGIGLFFAALAYSQLRHEGRDFSLVAFGLFIYTLLGSATLSKNKRLVKNPDMAKETNQISEKEATAFGFMMLGFYLLLPAIILVWAFVFS